MAIRKGNTGQQGTSGQSRPGQGAPGGFATESPKPVIVGEAKLEWPPSGAVLFEPTVDDGSKEGDEGGEDREGES